MVGEAMSQRHRLAPHAGPPTLPGGHGGEEGRAVEPELRRPAAAPRGAGAPPAGRRAPSRGIGGGSSGAGRAAAPPPASGRPWSREQGSAPEGGDPRRREDLGAAGLACAGPIPPRGGEIVEKMRRAGGEREGEPGCGWGREGGRMTSGSRRRQLGWS
jgi:hypothetical protein